MNFETTKHLLAGLTPCYPEWKGVYKGHSYTICSDKIPQADDDRNIRYRLTAWFFDPESKDERGIGVMFRVPGTIFLDHRFLSPKRWKLGFFTLKQVYTMTQEEMLAHVVLCVQDSIDHHMAEMAQHKAVFDKVTEAVQPEKTEDTSAQMAAGLFVAGAAAAEVIDAFYDDPV